MELNISDFIIGAFTLICTLITSYIITKIDKKEDKTFSIETKNAIKNSYETQKILPKISEIFVMISSKIEKRRDIDSDVEAIIYSKDSWPKLDAQITALEREVNELAKIDSFYKNYQSCASILTYSLLLLLIEIISFLLVYLANDIRITLFWSLATIETIIFIIIYKLKQNDICKHV